MSDQLRMKLTVPHFSLHPSTGELFDLSAFLLEENGRVRDPFDMIYFAFNDHIDSETGFFTCACRRRENVLYFIPGRIPARIAKVAIVLSIYPRPGSKEEDGNRQVGFALSECEPRDKDALLNFSIPCSPTETSTVLVGELTRLQNAWEFKVIGNRKDGELSDRCDEYGVPIIRLR